MELRLVSEKVSTTLITSIVLLLCAQNYVVPTCGAINLCQEKPGQHENEAAVEVSLQFTKRLRETKDLGVVMGEMFVPDAVLRSIASEKRRKEETKPSDFFWAPGLFIDIELLDKLTTEDWKNAYIAANNFLIIGFSYASKRNIDFSKDFNPTDLYPPEVISLLGRNPKLRNFIKMKDDIENFHSVEEVRNATFTLNKAVTIMRNTRAKNPATPKEIDEGLRELRESGFIKPQVEINQDENLGYPKGTQLVMVPAYPFYRLVLARMDGKLKIVWAYLNFGD